MFIPISSALVLAAYVYFDYRFCAVLDQEVNQNDPMDFQLVQDLIGDTTIANAMLPHIDLV